jgi:hypothetical protein
MNAFQEKIYNFFIEKINQNHSIFKANKTVINKENIMINSENGTIIRLATMDKKEY